MQKRLLFVDDEPAIRFSLAAVLRMHGFEVTLAATVAEALQKITSEKFEILLSDLNIGNPGDGLTVVSAMRRTQPEAVTMILTGYPAFETALEAIRQQVDDYIVKPADIPTLVNTIESKLSSPSRPRQLPPPKRVAMLLQENTERIKQLWLSAAEKNVELSNLHLKKQQRLDYLNHILPEVIRSAQTYSGEDAGKTEGGGENKQAAQPELAGYTAAAMLTEFCILRRVLAQVVQENLLMVNLSYLVPDLAKVNESLDEQAQAAIAILPGHIQNHGFADTA